MNQRWNQTLRFVAALLAIGAICALYWWRSNRLEHSQDSVIRAAASRYGVDPSLVKAVVWQESRFNPGIRGKANEIGLMQLQEVTAQEWADAEHVRPFQHEHCFNPLTNTLAGAWYLKKLLR